MPTHADYSSFAFHLDGYRINDDADDSSNDNIQYYGYIDRFGAWYIQKHDTTARTYRYAKGDSNFSTSWDSVVTREGLTYSRWDVTFK